MRDAVAERGAWCAARLDEGKGQLSCDRGAQPAVEAAEPLIGDDAARRGDQPRELAHLQPLSHDGRRVAHEARRGRGRRRRDGIVPPVGHAVVLRRGHHELGVLVRAEEDGTARHRAEHGGEDAAEEAAVAAGCEEAVRRLQPSLERVERVDRGVDRGGRAAAREHAEPKRPPV
eukprot:2646381-Prymnesium_polylepis.1